MVKKAISIIITVVLIPMITLLGALLFKNKQYALISIIIVLLSCLPLLIKFERRKSDTKILVVLAVMIALSVTGRFVFSFVPSFKPVTALIIITAMYFGSEAGFLTGSMTAIISNFYFGQGPWTPFQMFAWGFIGFLAGILTKQLKSSKIFLLIFGALSGTLFSLLMDVWTAVWWDKAFTLTRYLSLIATAMPITIVYAVSNVVFLLVLSKPIGKKLERIKQKYGI